MKLKNTLLLITFSLATSFLTAQGALQFKWIKSISGTTNTSTALLTDMATDSIGNTFVTGEFQGGIQFSNTISLTGNGNEVALFLAKYNPAGTALWAHKIVPQNPSVPAVFGQSAKVAADAAGRVLWAANYRAVSLEFSNNLTLTRVCTDGCQEGFLVQLDADGNGIFAKKLKAQTGMPFRLADIGTGTEGLHYVTGVFEGPELWLQGGANIGGITTDGFFLVEYEASGGAVWILMIPETSGIPEAQSLAVSPDGARIAVTGTYGDTGLNFGNSATTNSTAAHKQFIMWCNTGGQPLGAGTIDATEALQISDIRLDDQYNAWLAGNFKGDLRWNEQNIGSATSTAGTVVSVAQDGNFTLLNNFPYTGNSHPVTTLELGKNGQFYIGGDAAENMNLPVVGSVTNHGCSDLLLTGGTGTNFLTGASVGGAGCETMPNNYGGSYLGAGENNHIYFCGAHSNGGNIGGFPLVGNGLWVGKLGPAEAVSTASVAEKQFTISPNPASGWLDIRFGENGFSEGNIAVYNALGAAVLRQSVTSKNIRLDVSGWQEGSYFLQYLGEGVSVSSRVVVER